MAEFIVRVPGEPDRVVPLPRPGLVVGRHADCGLVIPEKKASKQHLHVKPRPDGPGWVAVDLQSSNGTLVGGERILRRALVPGDVLTIGDTTLELLDTVVPASGASTLPGEGAPGASAADRAGPVTLRGAGLVVGGSLSLAPAEAPAPAGPAADAAGAEADAPIDPEEEARAAQVAVEMEVRRAQVAGRRSVARAGVFAAASVAVLVAVQVLAGGVADRRAGDRAEAEAALEILKDRDRPYELLSDRFERFKAQFPRSRRLLDLERVVAAAGRTNARRADVEGELDRLRANATGRPDAEIVGRLEALLARVPEGDALRGRIDLELAERRRREEEALGREVAAVERAADVAVSQGAYASALRRLSAFAASHPHPDAAADERLRVKRLAVLVAAQKAADEVLAKAEGTGDPDVRRRVLLEGVRALAGTGEADRVASSLARVTGGALPTAPTPGAPPPLPGTGPAAAPTRLTADVLADVAKAEGLARERRYVDAVAAYERLIALDVSARVKADWTARREDLSRLVALVSSLTEAVAASGGKGVRVRLAAGPTDVLGVDGAGVRTKRGDTEATTPWASLAAPDLLALLGRGTLGPDERLALGLLAADLGERAEAIAHLTPLVGLESHRDRAFEIIARRLEGRTSVPEGGYVAFEGELLDRAEHGRRLEGRRLGELQTELGSLLGRIAADPAFKKLEALRAKRDELDKRRAYALLAIFNETHWPYPHDAPTIQGAYAAVTVEVQKRWHLVEEVWNDPLKVAVGKSPSVDRLLDRHAAILKELEAKGLDVAPFRAAIEPWALYAAEGTLTIRTYFRDKEERDLLAYNRWVMNTYNPGHLGGAADPEVEQIRITNEYRVMMGYMTTVQPSGTPISAIDGTSVAAILDQARETSRVPLRAVRIDERLVKSARNHSEDMSKRGFFDHFAPPNPATGEGRTSPFDRMATAGYQGGGASENIAMAGGPMEAHLRWLASSGHHRNILSAWTDQGVGYAGGRWTQNFASGGGAPAEIPGTNPDGK